MKRIKFFLFGFICVFFAWLSIDSILHIQAEVNHRMGYIQKERGYPHLANISYKIAVKLIPWENHYRLQLAKSYEDSAKKFPKRFQEYTNLAIKEYETLIKKDSMNPWYKARLGLIYYDLHDRFPNKSQYQKLAHDLALSATITDPKNPLFVLHYAHLLYRYKKIPLAKKYYLKAVEYDNDLHDAHFNLGTIYLMEKNEDDAMKHYKNILKYLNQLEKIPTASRSKQLTEKIDRYQNARIALAEYALKQNKIKEAYKIILSIPRSVEKYELLAKYHISVNQPKTAVLIYKQLNKQLNTNKYDSYITRLQSK